MKIIEKEEATSIPLKMNRIKDNPVLNQLKTIDVEQSLLVETIDWKPKTPPSIIVAGTFRDKKSFSVKRLADDQGWLITRLK